MPPRRARRPLARLALAVGLGGAALLALPAAASAELTGGGLTCSATLAGRDVGALSSDDLHDAVTVGTASGAPISMTADSRIINYTVDLEFLGASDDALSRLLHLGGAGWQAARGTGTTHSWSDTLAVDRYSSYGAGVYRAVAVGHGPQGQCTARALLRIDRNPLNTATGLIAAVGAVMAITLVIAAFALAAVEDPLPGLPPPGGDAVVTVIERPPRAFAWSGCLLPLTLPVVLLAGALTATGGSVPAGPAAGRSPRVRWKPRLSSTGVGGGILGALSVLILLQQYGRVFPTGTVLARALAAGLAAGVLIPSLGRLIAVQRANRRLRRRVRA